MTLWQKFAIFAAIVLLIGVIVSAFPAEPHESPEGWAYDQGCCNGDDCHQIDDSQVQKTDDGYIYNGQLIRAAAKRVKNSHDHHYHVCEWPEYADDMSIKPGRMSINCLYVPQPGA